MKSVASTRLSKLILRTIEVYNKYRSPEVRAKLLKLERNSFTIEFQGSFCQSCGVQDYFEDFIYELKDLCNTFEVKIGEINQISTLSFKVKYIVKRFLSSGKSDEEVLFQEFLQERGTSLRDYMASNPCTRDVIRFHFRTWLFERNLKRSKPNVV